MVSIEEIKVITKETSRRGLSLGKLSMTEVNILKVLYGRYGQLPHAINAYEIYLGIVELNYEEFKHVIEMEDIYQKERRKGSALPDKSEDMKFPKERALPLPKDMNPSKDWERINANLQDRKIDGAAQIMRQYDYDIPTYQRVVRALKGLYKDGWVEMRIAEPFKKGSVWYLPDKIRKKIKKEWRMSY
jgi:hypothetical protein